MGKKIVVLKKGVNKRDALTAACCKPGMTLAKV
jgi:hypothetical protein